MSFSDFLKHIENPGTEEVKRIADNVEDKKTNDDYVDFINRELFLRIDKINGNHSCFIDDSISSLENLSPLIILLNNMTEEETINVDINCCGGSIPVMGFICSAMLRCKGKVTTDNIGYAYSAGSMIWACGHELKVTENAHFMFHMAITAIEGRSDEKARELDHAAAVTKSMLSFCKDRGILTQDEVDQIIIKKEDVYITYNQMKSRLVMSTSFDFKKAMI